MGRINEIFRNLAVSFTKSHYSDTLQNTIHIFPNTKLWIQYVLSDFINLTQVHNFTVSAHDIFTIRRLSIFTVSFTGILQFLMQIMKRFVLSY